MMTDEVRLHWKLHELDEESARHAAELAKLPEARRVVEARVRAAKAALEALDARLAELQRQRREREREADALLANERHFESQRASVKNQQQFEAIELEIARVRDRRSDAETAALTLLESEEATATARPDAAQALQQAERDAADAGAKLEASEAAQRSAIQALEVRRSAALESLPPAARQRYERLRGTRGGRPVAAIDKQACGACFRGLSPHALQEARRAETLLVCDGCGRLMLLPPADG